MSKDEPVSTASPAGRWDGKYPPRCNALGPHRTSKTFTRYFPESVTVEIQSGDNHYHIKTPNGVVNWWPYAARFQHPNAPTSVIGSERLLIDCVRVLANRTEQSEGQTND